MSGTCFKCIFKTGYCLYARTCVGRCVHNYMLKNFRKTYGEKASHSQITPFLFGSDLLIVPMPYLHNNYCYVVADISEGNFVLVDVGDADLMKEMGAPDAVLTTHKHWDHSGGNKAMRAAYPGLRVYGGEKEGVPDATHNVRDGEVIAFGRLQFTAVWTPGHTTGHVVWKLSGRAFGTVDSLFTGDHLMTGCCGAHFEGSVEQMVKSLAIMKSFPDNTWVWPGHEAALSALQAAIFVDPTNMHALAKLAWVLDRRRSLKCSCPSTIGEEKNYNPYLRTDSHMLQMVLGLRKPAFNSSGNIGSEPQEPTSPKSRSPAGSVRPGAGAPTKEDVVASKDPMKMQVLCFEQIGVKSSKIPQTLSFPEQHDMATVTPNDASALL